jgi:hypothetical protein
MSTSIEIFAMVNDYIERKIKLRDLESWIVSMLPIYLSNTNNAASDLASIIELGLAEVHAGIRSERGLRKLLTQHLIGNPVKFESYPCDISTGYTISSGSAFQTTDFEWMDPSPSWHIVPEAEYV